MYLILIKLYRYNLGQGIQLFHFDYTTFYIIEWKKKKTLKKRSNIIKTVVFDLSKSSTQ